MKPLLMLILLAAGPSMQAVEPLEFRLWGVVNGVPGRMLPPSKATEDFIRTNAGKGALTNILEPTLTIHRPEQPNGTSVVVAPGGGYAFLSVVQEGAQVCEWLNSLGVTAILLKYRTPTRDEAAPHDKPVQDALRAISIVRDNAPAWKLDPKRVGLLGFGAGAEALAQVACDRAWQNQRPDFGIMIYGGVDPAQPPKLDESFSVPADAPPLFMACTQGNEPAFTTLTALHMACAQHHIPAQLHFFTKDGLYFGLRRQAGSANAWPQQCAQWMDDLGWLPSVAKVDAQIAKLRRKLEEMQPALRRMTGCGNNGEIGVTRKFEAACTALHEAELVNDSARVTRLKKEIAECKAFLKSCEESDQRANRFFAEAEAAARAVKSLELERARILQLIESFRWP